MLTRLDDYGWGCAFEYAGEPNADFGSPNVGAAFGEDIDVSPFGRADVVEIIGIDDGRPDELDWVIAGRLKDGRWFFLTAGCDFTGWD